MLINYIYIGVICDGGGGLNVCVCACDYDCVGVGGGGSIHTRHLVAAFDCLVAQALVGVRHGCLDLCCLDPCCLCFLVLYFPVLELVLARLYFLAPLFFYPTKSKEDMISNLLRAVSDGGCEFFCDYDFYENVPYI